MHVGPWIWLFVYVLETRSYVVGSKNGVPAYLIESVGAHAPNIGVGANEHAKIAVKAPYLSNRLRTIVVQKELTVAAPNKRDRQERSQQLFDTNRSGSGAATTV